MNWFLDMCIIVWYGEQDKKFYDKIINLLNNKENNFLVCCYITEENLPKWIDRQRAIIREVKRKIKSNSYEIGGGESLFDQDKIKAKKIFSAYLISQNQANFYKEINESNELLILRMLNFIKIKVKKVIPVKEIDFELKSTLFTFLKNNSDAMIMASGIQHHQIEQLILLTGDKKDWNKENIDWVFDSRHDLSKKYSKIPEIKYI